MLWMILSAAIFAVIDCVSPAYGVNTNMMQCQTVRIAASSFVPVAVRTVNIAVRTSALHVRMHMIAPGAPTDHANIVFLCVIAAMIKYVLDVVLKKRENDAIFAMIGCASTAPIIL